VRRIQTVHGRAGAECGELLVSLCYQPASDRLTVIVLKAKNLPRMDLTGLSGNAAVFLLYEFPSSSYL